MIHILIGTRAQLIKMIPLMHLLQSRDIEYNFIFMAQHHETIYEMLDDFGIKHPDYVIGDTGSDIVSSTQMALWSVKVLLNGAKNRNKIFQHDKEGVVLIHGDAPPLFLGAVLAKIQGLSVASVEAGLRSYRLFKPFPEELIRVITGRLGLVDIFYCQDEDAVRNTARYRGRSVNTDGNTIVDTIKLAMEINERHPRDSKQAFAPYAVVSLHRFETISSLRKLSMAVNLVLKIAEKIQVRFILHPPTREALKRFGLYEKLEASSNIELLSRMSFVDFNAFLSQSEFIVTDGGSNQEESAFIGVPCLLFRTETERSEGLGENVVLSNFDPQVINEFVNSYSHYRRQGGGDKKSPTHQIINDVLNHFSPAI